MNSHGNRARLGGVLVAVAAVLALVALPGLASGHRNHGDDPAPAGTISSFDQETGLLTIDLSDGGSVSGLVTRRTHVRCDNGRHRGRRGLRRHKRGHRASASRRGGESEPGDDSRGGRGSEVGEDQSGEPGDDRGAHAQGEDAQGEDHSHHCDVGDLTEGATVKIAVLVLVDGKAIFKVVGLPKQAPASEPEAPASE